MNADAASLGDAGDAPLEPYDLGRVGTTPLGERRHLVDTARFGELADPAGTVGAFIDSLPDVLAARALRELAGHIARAHRDGHGVAVAMGGHVVKTGCGPLIVDLMRRGIVTSLHMAGSAAIHDWELAFAGRTSEDVGAGLLCGEYGTSEETGRAFAKASARAADEGCGLGRALGASIVEEEFAHRDVSLLGEAARLGLPCTVHVAIGTDTVHVHPAVDGATLGEASLLDFRLACTVVSRLNHGVWLNLGSAVVMPEVLLKCVTVAANTGAEVDDLTTANFDMLRHYRTRTNVVQRPAARGYDMAGHHEIMIPLLRMAVLGELSS
jgi:hypothetical protein